MSYQMLLESQIFNKLFRLPTIKDMGATCAPSYIDLTPEFNTKDGRLDDAIRKMKQAPNEEFLYTLQKFIEISVAKNQNIRLNHLLNVSRKITGSLNRSRANFKPSGSLDEALINPMKDLQIVLKTISQEFTNLENQKKKNQQFIKKSQKPWWNSLDTLMKKTTKIQKTMNFNHIQLTQSRQSERHSEFSEAAGQAARRVTESQKIEQKILQNIQKIKRTFDPNEQITQNFEIKDNVLGRVEEIKKNLNNLFDLNTKLSDKIYLCEKQKQELCLKLQDQGNKIETLTNKLIDAQNKLSQISLAKVSNENNTEVTKRQQSYAKNPINHSKQQYSLENEILTKLQKNKDVSFDNDFQKTQSIFINFGCSEVLLSSENRISYSYRYCIDQMFESEGLKIMTTRKIYQYDHIRPNNLYYYLKDFENLIVLIKMKSGVILGGYSKHSFKFPKNDNHSFIFSITEKENPKRCNKMIIKSKELNKFSVKVDQDFLKFGSNEIRIRCESLEGFANIAGSTSIYHDPENPSLNIDTFLNQKEHRFAIQHYEIYTLNVLSTQPLNRAQSKKTLRKNSCSQSYISNLE